jgi:hypothetical protein
LHRQKNKLIIDSETVEMKSSYLVVKVNLRDATKGQAAVAKANNSEVDSKDIAGAKGDKKNDGDGATEEGCREGG